VTHLLHQALTAAAARAPEHPALVHGPDTSIGYAELAQRVARAAAQLTALDVRRGERVAVYLPKQPEAVIAMLAAAMSGAVFVPVNPLLKAAQVQHILHDCAVKVLVTSADRAQLLRPILTSCEGLAHVLVAGGRTPQAALPRPCTTWDEAGAAGDPFVPVPVIDQDVAALLYTSGSTGAPKGVIVSHRNLMCGARSVAEYLRLRAEDRLLAVLPFSFDYGLNQLTSAILAGATCVLIDYLMAQDVIRALARHRITGLAAVPSLWCQLAALDWPPEATRTLRYITNSGGALPPPVLASLRRKLPDTAVYLMYGLTEAFRSTYLEPERIDERPGSIGKAVPNAEVLVVNAAGEPCAPYEPGELVHRGALVTLGYWNDPQRTRERFRPAPGAPAQLPIAELAVWSGDTVYADADGYLYFVGRSDDLIKTSGYRVSPEEVEQVVHGTGLVAAAAAIGVAHDTLGQAIVAVVVPAPGSTDAPRRILEACRAQLPRYLVPVQVLERERLPHTPNGKLDRRALAAELAGVPLHGEGSATGPAPRPAR